MLRRRLGWGLTWWLRGRRPCAFSSPGLPSPPTKLSSAESDLASAPAGCCHRPHHTRSRRVVGRPRVPATRRRGGGFVGRITENKAKVAHGRPSRASRAAPATVFNAGSANGATASTRYPRPTGDLNVLKRLQRLTSRSRARNRHPRWKKRVRTRNQTRATLVYVERRLVVSEGAWYVEAQPLRNPNGSVERMTHRTAGPLASQHSRGRVHGWCRLFLPSTGRPREKGNAAS